MSSKKTDYLKMHDWTEADPWRLAEVSENFKKMDKKAKDLDTSMATTVSTAADAKTTANGIDAKATDALAKSTEAVQNVSTAVQKANSAESKATEAKTVSDNALAKAGTAESIANGVQTQFNQVVITGDSSVEAAQARVNTSGQTYSTLKQRLDSEHQEVTVKLADTTAQQFNTTISATRKRKPVLTPIDDDGNIAIMTKLKPMIERLKVPMSCTIPTSRIDTHAGTITSANMRELASLGFEFTSHTHTHPYLAQLTAAEIENEFRASKEWMFKNGYNADVIVYPFGSVNNLVKDIAAKYFRLGVNIDNNSQVNRPPLDSYSIQRVYIDLGVENAKAKIDDIVANGGWMVLGMHCHYADFNPLWVEDVINYAISQGVEIKNCKDALAYYGNYLEAGDGSKLLTNGVTIDADGNVHGGKMGVTQLVDFSNGLYAAANPVTDYTPSKISIGYINAGVASGKGFPENKAGILEVHRFASDAYSYQIFQVVDSNATYRRRWIPATSSWSAWESNKPIVSLATVQYTNTTSYNSIDKTSVTYSKINTVDATGFPGNRAGLLVSVPFYGNGFAQQNYYPVNTTEIHRRYWDGSTWSDWKRVDTVSYLKTVTLVHGSIPARATADYTITSSVFSLGDNIIPTPKTLLPAGIIAGQVWVSANGTAKLRLANVTDTTIDVGSADWVFKDFVNA